MLVIWIKNPYDQSLRKLKYIFVNICIADLKYLIMQTPDNLATNSIAYYTKLYPNTTNTTFIPNATYIQAPDSSATTMSTPTNLKKYKEGEDIIYRRLCGTWTPDPVKITCLICPATFTVMKEYTQHVLSEHRTTHTAAAATTSAPEPKSDDDSCISDDGEIAIACLICRNTFTSNTQRANHMRMAHGADENPYVCEECGSQFWSKAEHGNHMAIWHPVATKPGSVHLDSSVSSCINSAIVKEETPDHIWCQTCNTAIPVDQSLRHELRCRPAAAVATDPEDGESSEKINYCQRCNILFDNFGDYMQHDAHCLDYDWPGDEDEYYDMTDYYCQICGLDHATVTLRDEHQATCTYENEYRCDCCGTEVFNNMDMCMEHEISCWKDFEKEERREARLHSFSRK